MTRFHSLGLLLALALVASCTPEDFAKVLDDATAVQRVADQAAKLCAPGETWEQCLERCRVCSNPDAGTTSSSSSSSSGGH